jgi:hypothetical protein
MFHSFCLQVLEGTLRVITLRDDIRFRAMFAFMFLDLVVGF